MGVQHGQLFTGSCLVPPMQTPKSPKWAICLLESLVLIWCARTSLSLLPGTTGPTSTIQCQCFRTNLIKFVKNILNNWEKCTSWFFSISCKSLQNIHHLVSPSPIISPPQSRNPNRRRLGFLPQEGPNQEPSQQGWKNEGPPGAPSSNRDRPLRWKDTASKKEQKCTKKNNEKGNNLQVRNTNVEMSNCKSWILVLVHVFGQDSPARCLQHNMALWLFWEPSFSDKQMSKNPASQRDHEWSLSESQVIAAWFMNMTCPLADSYQQSWCVGFQCFILSTFAIILIV